MGIKELMCLVAPTLEVAALSATMDGIIPRRTLFLMDSSETARILPW